MATGRSDFVLDTGVVLHYARSSPVADAVEKRYKLRAASFKPFVCVVTLGEIRAIARRHAWGKPKLQRLDDLLRELVALDISSDDVIDAYATIHAKALTCGWSIHQKKNDLWIAAVTHVTGATLLTTDGEFDPLDGSFLNRVLIDNRTGAVK
jgi:tRNA(fMet)-specific endonuclease VapC